METDRHSDEPVLYLSDQLVISRGSERICYQHPEDKNLVIKIPLHGSGRKAKANQNEMRGYRLLQGEGADLSFASHCHGFVDTDRGQGLICDCIRDFDGAISRTIWDIIIHQENCDVDYIIEITDDLCNLLMARRIWLFDLNPKNIALQRLADGSYRPYVIDLKGRYLNNEKIPLSRYISYFSMIKLRRRSNQLLQRITDFRKRRKDLQLYGLGIGALTLDWWRNYGNLVEMCQWL